MKTYKMHKIFQNLSKSSTNPKTELIYKNPYTFLISVVLSAQATDKSVNKATKELFKKVKEPEEMIKLGERRLKTFIKSIGLYNSAISIGFGVGPLIVAIFGSKGVKPYRWLYVCVVFIGALTPLTEIINLSDVFNALMAFPNLIALLILSPQVSKEQKDKVKLEELKLELMRNKILIGVLILVILVLIVF